MMKNKLAIIFTGGLVAVGGAERLLLEEAKHLQEKGLEVKILTYHFDEKALFGDFYNYDVIQVGNSSYSNNLLQKIFINISNIYNLRRMIKEIKPDIIISTSALDCSDLNLATLLTPFLYVTHIHGTIFWFQNDQLKYTLIHRKVFHEIRKSVIGHKEFIPEHARKAGLKERIAKELHAIAIYLGVRNAKSIFVLSNQMKWEVKKLYGKDATVLKGAFPKEILNYRPNHDIKKRYNLTNKRIILNINRLDPRKRVDTLIKSFKLIESKYDDVILIIGGVGGEEEKLKNLVKYLGINDKVRLIGFIEENELWDYLASCDVFVHPNWADFAIAAYEPLVLQKNVVWSTEMEVDEYLKNNGHIFSANPTVNELAQAIERALTTEVNCIYDMSEYTWDNYFKKLHENISTLIGDN